MKRGKYRVASLLYFCSYNVKTYIHCFRFRGKMQTLVYSVNKLGQIFINIIILFGFSGPMMNCVGYELNPDVPCSTNIAITKRVDPDLYQSNPNGWCYEKCHQATFDWDLSIP